MGENREDAGGGDTSVTLQQIEARRLTACVWFWRLFRDVSIANRLAEVAVAYWQGERQG